MLVRKRVFIFLVILIFFSFPISVDADMGPKPKLIVIVENPPEGEYYLDLLLDYDMPLCKNLSGPETSFDAEKLRILNEYNENGWYCALAHGTRYTVWGKLTGNRSKEVMKHPFGYFGLPERYKIIIVTPENEVRVTRIIERKSYSSVVHYDYKTGEIKEAAGISLVWTCFRQFLMSFTSTIILESIILLLFRFKKAHTLIVVLITNLTTQVFMTLVMSTALLVFGIYASYVILFGVEIIVTTTEAIIYGSLFTEKTRKIGIAYAVSANIASALAMLPLMYLEYLLFL